MQISPTQDQIQTSLRSFLLAVLPAQTDVIIAIQNRVPEPQYPNFVIISPLRFERSDTNIDSYADVKFTAAIALGSASFTGSIAPAAAQPNVTPSGILTVSAIASGSLAIGGLVAGGGVLAGTTILSQISGSAGGTGTYAVNYSQTVSQASMTESYGVMTVSAISFGMIKIGATVFGVGLAASTMIQANGTGSGGTGTYIVSPSQTVGSQVMASGAKLLQQNAKVAVQIDFHSGDNSASDMAQTVSTILRDGAGVDLFAAQIPNYGVVPLYADDPRYMPFLNEALQSEWRFVLECYLQVNQIIAVPSQFADSLEVTPVDVLTAFPP